MEQACLRRDAGYDGVFFLAVRTTGIFCRPSCPARKPRPDHVEYYSTPTEALRAGYRACLRCRPLEADGRPPAWVARLLAKLGAKGERLRDDDLRDLAVDPARARRYFRRHFGMTFQQFQRSQRMGTALAELKSGAPLVGVGAGHGYESDSGFRDAFARTFGRPPGEARDADCVVVQTLASPIGPLVAAATSDALCALEFGEARALDAQAERLARIAGGPLVPGTNAVLKRLAAELDEYFVGRRREFGVPLTVSGTAFQQRVWQELQRIPYGQAISYAELAQRIGRPLAQRAVGQANHCNRIAIVIPCHRVVNAGGKLGGYGGGLWRKQFLLELERGTRS